MIIISDNLRLRKKDTLNIVLEELMEHEERGTKEKYTEWTIIGYYGDIKSALVGAVRALPFEVEKDINLQKVYELVERLEKTILSGEFGTKEYYERLFNEL